MHDIQEFNNKYEDKEEIDFDDKTYVYKRPTYSQVFAQKKKMMNS